AEAMGNLVPANVPVDPSSGCGAAQIIMIVIAIIVTIYTAGAASGAIGAAASSGAAAGGAAAGGAAAAGAAGAGAAAGAAAGAVGAAGAAAVGTAASTFATGLSVLSGAVGGFTGIASAAIGAAVGSAASQLAGMAMGVVDEFSWRQVGISALTAGVTAGVGSALNGSSFMSAINGVSPTLGQGVQTAIGATLAQGTGSALGISHFSWRNVAGSAAGAMAGSVAGNLASHTGNQVTTQFAANLASAAVSQKVSTGHFSWSNTLPQAVGNTIGDLIKDDILSKDAAMSANHKAGEQNSAADQDAGRYIYVGGGTSEDFEQDLDEDFGGSFTGAPRRKQPPVAGRLPYGAIAGHAGPAGPVGGYDLSMGITVEAQSLTDYALENDLKLTPTVEHLAAALGRSRLEDVYNYVSVNNYSLAPTPENALRYGLSSRFSAGEPEMYTPGNPVYALENGYTPFEGFFTNEYNKVAAGYRDPNTSALGKIGYGFGATIIAPFMLVEGGGLGLLNAPNNLYVAGQRFVHAVETGNLSQLSMAFLQTGEGIFGLTPLTAIPSKTIALPSRTVTPRVVTPDHMLPDNFVLPENEMLTRMNALRGKYAHLSSEQRLAMRESNAERWVKNYQSMLNRTHPNLHAHFWDKHAPDISLPNLAQRSIDGTHPRFGTPGAGHYDSSQFSDFRVMADAINEAITRNVRGLPTYNVAGKPWVIGNSDRVVGWGYQKLSKSAQASGVTSPAFVPSYNNWVIRFDSSLNVPYTGFPVP
ncbi:hypothetical protein, partial [Parachitinimonas caeni]